MGGLIPRILIVLSVAGLTACPMKDWLKRDDTYLTVEQYKTMTEVVNVNDTLYRVRRGEEINQNKITQLFFNVQQFVSTPEVDKNRALKAVKSAYNSEKSIFNTLTYSLVLLSMKNREQEAFQVLTKLNNTGMKAGDKDLINLTHILHSMLRRNATSKQQYATLTDEYELVTEEVNYLKKQINALKSIEDNIHARESEIIEVPDSLSVTE